MFNLEKVELVFLGISFCSGFGFVSVGLILEKYGNDYFFVNFIDFDDNNLYIEKSDFYEIMGNVYVESVYFINVIDELLLSLLFLLLF